MRITMRSRSESDEISITSASEEEEVVVKKKHIFPRQSEISKD